MADMDRLFHERITAFIDEYLELSPQLYDDQRLIREEFIEQAINFLLDGKIFTPNEMVRQAAKDHLIIIPEYYFESWRRKNDIL